MIAAKTLLKYELVEVQEVRRDKDGADQAGEYMFFYGKENENHELGTSFSLSIRG
jgi:hypothetical protein